MSEGGRDRSTVGILQSLDRLNERVEGVLGRTVQCQCSSGGEGVGMARAVLADRGSRERQPATIAEGWGRWNQAREAGGADDVWPPGWQRVFADLATGPENDVCSATSAVAKCHQQTGVRGRGGHDDQELLDGSLSGGCGNVLVPHARGYATRYRIGPVGARVRTAGCPDAPPLTGFHFTCPGLTPSLSPGAAYRGAVRHRSDGRYEGP